MPFDTPTYRVPDADVAAVLDEIGGSYQRAARVALVRLTWWWRRAHEPLENRERLKKHAQIRRNAPDSLRDMQRAMRALCVMNSATGDRIRVTTSDDLVPIMKIWKEKT